jgi:hypothetical protein
MSRVGSAHRRSSSSESAAQVTSRSCARWHERDVEWKRHLEMRSV